MATFTRIHIAQTMARTGMVPLFYHPDPEVCRQVAAACYAGGARVLEFTNRGPGAFAAFQALRAYASAELPELALGIGSIVDAGTTALYLQAGADFIVSPILNPEMARICNRRKILWSPGCGTLSEVSQAEELGAEIVKVFPGDTLGPGFIKAVKGPCPWSSLMPTGGVSPTPDNLRAWLDAGAVCVGMGSQLISKDIIARQAWDELEARVTEALALIGSIRAELGG